MATVGNGIEPALDDIVERSFGYQMLLSSQHMSELLAGFMTAGAVNPPARPSRVSDLDPALVLNEAQEQLRRRLEQISPAAGRHYVGMWQAVKEASQRVTPVADTFNNAREMISALTEVLRALAGVDSKFLDSPNLGVPENVEEQRVLLVHELAEVVRASRSLQLHKVTHRHGVGQPRPMTEEQIDRAHSVEGVAQRFVALYEKNIDVVHREVDRLLATSGTKQGASRLASLAAPDHVAIQSFFDRLEDPGWWSVLRGKRFFDEPPEPPEDLIHPRWPQTRFLARVASRVDNPGDLAGLLVEIGSRTRNVRVKEDLLRAAAALPPKYAAQVMASEQSWPWGALQARVARLATGREIIRYPAWRAALMAHIATHPDAAPEDQLDAERALRTSLWVRIETRDAESAPEFIADEIDDSAVRHVLMHLWEHSNAAERALVLRLVEVNVREISEGLIRLMQGEKADGQDDQYLREVLGWYLAEGAELRSDRSHLVMHSWLGDLPNEGVEALEGLVIGLSGLIAATLARGDEPVGSLRISNLPKVKGAIGLRERALLTAPGLIDPIPVSVAQELLTDPELAQAAVVREEYTELLGRTWQFLDLNAQQSIRTVLTAESPSTVVAKLIGCGPLVGLENGVSEESFDRRALSVTDDPTLLLAIARGRFDRRLGPVELGELEILREDVEPGPGFARGADPVETRLTRERHRLSQLRAMNGVPSSDHWAEVLDSVGPRLTAAENELSCDSARAEWIALMVGWVAEHGLPEGANLRRLQQFVLQRRWRWAAAPDVHRADQIAHHGLDLARSSPHAQVLILRVCALLRQPAGSGQLSEKQRRKLIRSLRVDVTSKSPLRLTLLTVLGQLLPLIHADAGDVWEACIAPLIQDLPEIESTGESIREPVLSPHGRDLAALYSGLIMSSARASEAFTTETLEFLVWCYKNLTALQIPGGLDPHPIITHARAVMVGDLLRADGPGATLRAVLDAAPTLLSVGAVRMFSKSQYSGGPVELGDSLRRFWTAIGEWAVDNPERGGEVLAAIGSWAENTEMMSLLGPEWCLDQIDAVLVSGVSLDVSNELFESLADLAVHSPVLGEPIVRIVLKMRVKGLLTRNHGRGLDLLIFSLTELSAPPACAAELRSALIADRLIGPLAGH